MTQRDTKIERRYRAGASMADIGREFDISRERVRQILQRRGVDGSRQRWRGDLAKAVKLVTQKRMAPTMAAAASGVGVEALRAELKRQGYSHQEHKNAEQAKVREARLAGKGRAECRVCGEAKSWSEFAVDKDRHGVQRRRRICKGCANLGTRAWYRANRGRTPDPTVKERGCTKCGEVKPAGEFYRNTSTATGLMSWCKTCFNEHREVEGT